VLIQFIYQDNNYSIKKELVAKQLCDSVFKIITLPDSLEIEFITMSDSVYGETMLDSRFKNRIRINSVLTEREIIIPIPGFSQPKAINNSSCLTFSNP
jgi:hypothetical protein